MDQFGASSSGCRRAKLAGALFPAVHTAHELTFLADVRPLFITRSLRQAPEVADAASAALSVVLLCTAHTAPWLNILLPPFPVPNCPLCGCRICRSLRQAPEMADTVSDALCYALSYRHTQLGSCMCATLPCWLSTCRSLRQAPEMADAVSAALAKGGSVQQMSEAVWDALWSQERRQQVSRQLHLLYLGTEAGAGLHDYHDKASCCQRMDV